MVYCDEWISYDGSGDLAIQQLGLHSTIASAASQEQDQDAIATFFETFLGSIKSHMPHT